MAKKSYLGKLVYWGGTSLIASLLLCAAQGMTAKLDYRTLRTPNVPEGQEPAYEYFTGLLRLALERGAPANHLPDLSMSLAPASVSLEEALLARQVDIVWMGASAERQRKFRMIPIPLARGIFAFRKLIIKRSNLARFLPVKDLAGLKAFRACHALSEADIAALKTLGGAVKSLANDNELYPELMAGHCDYVLQPLYERELEWVRRQSRYPELLVYQPLVIHFPYAFFYFVRREDETLANWIEAGLRNMAFSGEITQYMQRNGFTKNYFPLEPVPRFLTLPNTSLPREMDPMDGFYWLQEIDFQPLQ